MKSNKRLALILLLFFSGFIQASAQIFTESKKIIKSYKVDKTTVVDITNKYGKIHLVPWDKDSVKIVVDMLIQSRSEERIEKIRNDIDFDFTQSGKYIIAQTYIGQRHSGLLKDLKEMAEILASGGNDVGINYKVYLPTYVNVKLNNKYGDIYATDINGSATIKLTNGDLKVNNITGNVDIDLKFSDAVINSVKSGRINLYFSELYLKKADELNMYTKSSKINIDEVKQIKTLSKRDKLNIKKIDRLYGSSSFTDFWIYELNDESSFNVKYGTMNFEKISSSFSFLNLTSRYTDISFYFASGSNYELDITHEQVAITYPLDKGTLEKKKLEGDDKKYISYGKLGIGSSTAKVKINAVEGSINIIHK